MPRNKKLFVSIQPYSRASGANSWFWQVFLQTPTHLKVVEADTFDGTEAEAQEAAKMAREAYRRRRSVERRT